MKKKNVKVNEDELFELLEDQKVELRDVREIGEESYLEYSMAVIVARALPDARDGLKPVHRRILFAMNDLGVTYKSSYKKSARIVGDVIGKYHPHGDSSVYEAMVRMAQPFAMRIQLIDGQGNFGSIDGDSAAAMRYTEARMGSIPSTFCFKDLDPSIVDFAPNYDGSESEPTVLPIKYPNLLVNGIHGIAVGMASEIAPHNPIEVMKAVEYKVENRITGTADNIDDLVRIIPAPDFPTGGYAHGTINMKEAWERGTGKIHLRGVWDIEEEYGKTFVNIKEIPYQVNKFKLVEAMKALVKPHPETKLAKIEGVSNIEDYSDKEGIFIQVVIKNEYDAEMIMNELLAQTQLQETFNYNATVLIKENGRLIPKRLGLNELLDQFIDFRLDVIERRTHLADGKLAARQHVLEALRKAIDPGMIEKVISTIRANKDSQSAKEALMNLLDIDEGQADQVLQIRLNRLTGLEVDKIDDEIGEIESTRAYYKTILADDKVRLGIILEESEDVITEFSRIKNVKPCDYKGVKYCLQERLTEFQQDVIRTDLAATTKEEECNIIVSAEGFIRRVPMSELTTMNRGARGRKQIELGKTDFVNLSIQSHSHDALLFITDKGQCYAKFAYDIPDKKSGLHVNRLLSLSDKGTEKIVDIVTVNFEKEDQLVAMFTKGGLVKISKLSAYMSASRKGGIKAVTLRENDEILSAALCTEEDQIFMVNSASKIIRFDVNTVNVVGRTASGVMGMKLDKDVNVVGASVIKGDSGYIVCVSEKGLIKVTEENQYRTQSRNGKGLFVMKESARSGQLFNAFFVSDLEEEDVVFTTKKGYSNRSALSTFKATNRNTSGVMLTKLEEDDCLVDIFHAPHQEMEEEFDMDLSMDEVVDMDSETEETTSED